MLGRDGTKRWEACHHETFLKTGMAMCCTLTMSLGSCAGCSLFNPPDQFFTCLCAREAALHGPNDCGSLASCFLLGLANGRHLKPTEAKREAGVFLLCSLGA